MEENERICWSQMGPLKTADRSTNSSIVIRPPTTRGVTSPTYYDMVHRDIRNVRIKTNFADYMMPVFFGLKSFERTVCNSSLKIILKSYPEKHFEG
ncbi:hypothetical protein HZH68_000293 [Vespula germanica]|uniref:Uncharacterized protein n=1 Tax=Vespula germanica TaxID=30212 RepID=A0A834NTA5_VESGE|nr:hypothetical protein HZH68_000293 [Vespula germanica]